MDQVFISYAREDRELAQRLYRDLLRAGVQPWLDLESLIPGQAWKQATERAIQDSRYFLALLSRHSLSKRGYVQKELRLALELLEKFPVNDIFLIPVRLEECAPADQRVADLHWVDLFPSYEPGFRRLIQLLKGSAAPAGSGPFETRTWSPDLQVDKGIVPVKESFAFDSWDQKIYVTSEGDAIHRVDARLMNISDRLLSELSFPVYCDAEALQLATGWVDPVVRSQNRIPAS